MANQIPVLKKRPIIGSNINMLPISSKYAGEMIRLRNQERAKYFLSIREDLTLEQQYNWITKYLEKDNEVGYVVEDKRGNVIGSIFLYNYAGSSIEIGRITFDLGKTMGKPFAIEAASTLLDIAFDNLGVEVVEGFVKEDNPLVKFCVKFGFTKGESETIRGHSFVQIRLNLHNRKYKAFHKYIEAWKVKPR